MLVSKKFLQLVLLVLLLHGTIAVLLMLSEDIANINWLIGLLFTAILFTGRSFLRKNLRTGFYLLYSYVIGIPLFAFLAFFDVLPGSPFSTLSYLTWMFFALILALPLPSAYRQFQARSALLSRYMAHRK